LVRQTAVRDKDQQLLETRKSAHKTVHPKFFIDNLLVRIHFIIVMIGWTGLAPWEFEFLYLLFTKVRCVVRQAVVRDKDQQLPWREAGPPNHHDDQVGSDQ